MDTEERARERARARAKELKGFWVHLFVYVPVMALLIVIDLANGTTGDAFIGLDWAYWPLFGWGFFVMLHGAQLFVGETLFGSRWEDRKVEQYMQEERDRSLLDH